MKKKILFPLLSVVLVACAGIAIMFGMMTPSKAECQLPEGFATPINPNSSFAYGEIPEMYKTVSIQTGSSYVTKSIDSAMILTGENSDSSNTVNIGVTFSSIISTTRLKENFDIIQYTVLTDEFTVADDVKAEPIFSSITLKLTEVENPSNYVTITNMAGPYANYVTIVRAGATGVQEAGRNGNGSFYDGNGLLYGSSIKGSFTGSYLDKKGNTREIFVNGFKYDNATKCAYAFPNESKGNMLVRDFDDPSHMIGLDELFSGFKTERIQASLTVNAMKAGKVRVAIYTFNGAKLYAEEPGEIIKDTKAPEVYPTNYLEGVKAEVGVPFPIFSYNSYDDIDGLGTNDTAKVYLNYGTLEQEELPITNGRFTPNKTGTYTVVASKTDSSGNRGEVTREVVAVKKLPPLSINLNGSVTEQVVVGNYVKLPTAVVSGGTEGKGYKIKVLKDGEEVAVDKKNKFLVSKQGVYEVIYSAYDYIDNPTEFKYFVRGYFTPVPQVDFPNMPKSIALGATLDLPEFKALDWYSFAGTCVDAIVTPSLKKDGGDFQVIENSYKFTEKGSYTYRITVKSVIGDNAVSQDYPIEVIDAELVSDYFQKNDIYIEEYDDNMVFMADHTGSSFSFINPLPYDIYRLVFNISEDFNKFSGLRITFTDSVHLDQKVTVVCKPNGKEGLINVCGTDYKVSSSFIGKDFSLSFARGALYDLSNYVSAIATYDNGEDFEGFTSGYIYADIAFEGVTGKAGIMIKTLCNHADFALDATDFMGPNISILTPVKSIAYVGDIFALPEASAYDVFTGKSTIKYSVTVRANEMATDSKSVPISKDNTISITEFGIYSIRIEATDATGHKTAMSQTVYSYNTTGPTITVLGEVVRTGEVGKKITLPNASAVDFYGKEVNARVFVLKKGGEGVLLNDKTFTPDESTDYIVWYTAYDNDFNSTIIKYTIKVK